MNISLPKKSGVEITEEVIELYQKLDIQNEKLALTLYTVLYAMSDAYSVFERDFVRLVNMIDEATENEIINKFDAFEKVHYELKIAKEEQKATENRNRVLEAENLQLKKELEYYKKNAK